VDLGPILIMNKNKKIALITGSVATALTILGISSLALFTARTDSDFTAKAGTVTIDLKDLELTNKENINPGDNDPSVSAEAAKGTSHEFTYDIYNTGNKSIRTRQTILLTADKAGTSVELLDARYLALFKDAKEIESKTYVLSDNSEVSNLDGVTKDVKAVKYVFIGDIFDGKGVDAENKGDAEKESAGDVVKQNDAGDVIKEYKYDFSLLKGADNKYQGCDIHLDVNVEAIQYRNTTESDWSESAIVAKEYSTANVNLNVVPAANEDKDGNIIK